MIYIETGSTDPYYNLAFEEYVFSELSRDREYFMLWQNENTIVVGKYQNTREEINSSYVEENGVRVARRLSGGGAVYHDLGNLNFSFIVDAGSHRDFDFKVFILPLIDVLRDLGVNAQFNGRNDITIDNRKFSGNSQYMRGGRLLHHGTLMLSSDLGVVEKALRVSEGKLSSKSVKSVRSRVTTISEHISSPISMDDFKRLILGRIFASSPMESWSPSDTDLDKIRRLRDDKYATWEWNYGHNPEYSLTKKQRLEGVGEVSVSMELKSNRIAAMSIHGDYFGSESPDAIINALIGCKLEKRAVLQALRGIELSQCIANITPEQLALLLTQ